MSTVSMRTSALLGSPQAVPSSVATRIAVPVRVRFITTFLVEDLRFYAPGVKRGSSAEASLPNGSRLSCGRNARGRKEPERQTHRLAGEATQFLPTCERPTA